MTDVEYLYNELYLHDSHNITAPLSKLSGFISKGWFIYLTVVLLQSLVNTSQQ